ncbi:hypothetical protein C1645_766885 [Glomus cerebriforme]|uniref:Uncharacterized protein n=1 Tax=Glomus cerebriforme TaxID=658196 RepID=A0A397T495_9GLOM|nr:hypothetical protein C1645_766885 [Glomus cerebriforme]
MVQRCCCCINLRIGTILISLIVLAQSLVGVYIAFSFVDSATKFSKALGYIHGIWNIIRGVMAVGGLIGGIMQNAKLVKLFSVIISVSALFYLVFGISISIISFKNKDKLVDMCLSKYNEQAQQGNYWSPLDHWSKPFEKRQENNAELNNQSQRELCQQAVKFYLGFAVAYTIFGFLLMFYFATVTSNYKEELRKEDMYKKVKGLPLDDNRSAAPEEPARGIKMDI